MVQSLQGLFSSLIFSWFYRSPKTNARPTMLLSLLGLFSSLSVFRSFTDLTRAQDPLVIRPLFYVASSRAFRRCTSTGHGHRGAKTNPWISDFSHRIFVALSRDGFRLLVTRSFNRSGNRAYRPAGRFCHSTLFRRGSSSRAPRCSGVNLIGGKGIVRIANARCSAYGMALSSGRLCTFQIVSEPCHSSILIFSRREVNLDGLPTFLW